LYSGLAKEKQEEIVATYRRKRETRLDGPFSGRLIEMLESPAYMALGGSARKILDRLEIEHAGHGGNDNGKLPCTYEQFMNYGVDSHAIRPGLDELIALGFIEITEEGRAGNADWRRPNLFRLTYRYLGNARPTNEWRRIRTVHDAKMIVRRARRLGIPKQNPMGVSPAFRCGIPQYKTIPPVAKSPIIEGSPNAIHTGESPITSILTPLGGAIPLPATAPSCPKPSGNRGSAFLAAPSYHENPELIAAAQATFEAFCPPGWHERVPDPWALRPELDHQKHSRKGLMGYVANLIEEQLHGLDKRRISARRALEWRLSGEF
jgi:hypothetical protein